MFFEKNKLNMPESSWILEESLRGGFMMLYAVLFIVFLMLILYLMPVKISIGVEKHSEYVKISFQIETLYGLLNIKTELPIFKLTFENGKPSLKYKIEEADRRRSRLLAEFTKLFDMKEGKGFFRVFLPLRYIIRKITVRNLYLKLGIGTGDAAATGVLYGFAWIAIGNIMTYTGSHVNIEKQRIIILPTFGSVSLHIDFSCIINIKTGHIINAGIRAIPALISGNRKSLN